MRAGFLAADFLVALRGRAAVEARFWVLPLALFAFRGFSVGPATASLNALAAVETISLPASTVALAASVTTSCADFATSTLAFAASVSACSVEARTPSPSLSIGSSPSIISSLRKKVCLKRHIQIGTGSIPASKKTCGGFDARLVALSDYQNERNNGAFSKPKTDGEAAARESREPDLVSQIGD